MRRWLNELAGRRCAAAMLAGNERLVDFWNWVEWHTRDKGDRA